MNRFNRMYTRLAGAMLILGPALLVCAALLAAAGIGSNTGRWYDNALEGTLMATGFGLLLIGLLELGRRIGATRPVLGIVTTLTSVLGTVGSIMPATTRILGTRELARGVTVEQLDAVHGGETEMSGIDGVLLLFILCFFANFLLIAFGLWRAKLAPTFTPVLLAVGVVLFVMGQSSFEVNWPAYIAAVSAWFVGLAPLGVGIIRSAAEPSRAAEAAGG